MTDPLRSGWCTYLTCDELNNIVWFPMSGITQNSGYGQPLRCHVVVMDTLSCIEDHVLCSIGHGLSWIEDHE